MQDGKMIRGIGMEAEGMPSRREWTDFYKLTKNN